MNPLKILLVEDEIGIAMLMERQLEDLGYLIHTHVTMGQEAVDAARETRPDVILMDIRLAGPMDGIEAALAIRMENLPCKVIFVTGYDDEKTKIRALEAFPLAFFQKPVKTRDLGPLLESL